MVPPRIVTTKSIDNRELPMTLEQLKEAFRRFDRNKDGQLSREELREAFKHLGSQVSFYRTLRACYLADSDNDGCINLDTDEFSALLNYAHSCGYKLVK